jgi:hypothetical protein
VLTMLALLLDLYDQKKHSTALPESSGKAVKVI